MLRRNQVLLPCRLGRLSRSRELLLHLDACVVVVQKLALLALLRSDILKFDLPLLRARLLVRLSLFFCLKLLVRELALGSLLQLLELVLL